MRLEVTLDGLRQAIHRVDQQKLEPEDWPLIRALLWNQFIRSEGRQERQIAKITSVKRIRDFSSGILKQLLKVVAMAASMVSSDWQLFKP